MALGFPGGARGKEFTCQCRRHKRRRFDPWVGKIPWRRAWQPTPVFLPGESHGQRSLVGYTPWGRKESDMSEHLSTQELELCDFTAEGVGSIPGWGTQIPQATRHCQKINKHTQLMSTLFWKWEHNVKSSVVNSQTPWQPVDYNPEVVLQSICKMFTAVPNATVGSIFSSPLSSIPCQPRSPIHFIS